jgi:hypothetical protein
MDVINETKLRAAEDEVVQHAIDAVLEKVIPTLKAGLASLISDALTQASDLLTDAAATLAALLAEQDGWTVTIGPTTIRLNKPGRSAKENTPQKAPH